MLKTSDPPELPGSQRDEGDGLIGRTLADSYPVEKLLGQGGMGAVYLGRNLQTGEACAIKVLSPEAAANSDILRRFQDEARITSALRHPHIVQVMDFQVDRGRLPFLVMELLQGEDLQQRLARVGRMPLGAVLEMARQLASALQAAHDKGVVHRDVKPQNIFLAQRRAGEGDGEVAKILDFGISKIRHAASQHTRDLTLLGTPQFMSPEAALGQNSQLDGRADQWGLAVLVYCALSGVPPFDGENMMGVLYQVVNQHPRPLSQLCSGLPAHVVAAVERAMAKRKEDRFESVADFARALGGGLWPGVMEEDVTRSAWLPRTPMAIPQEPLPEGAEPDLTKLCQTPPPVSRPDSLSMSQISGQISVPLAGRSRRQMALLFGGLMGTALLGTLVLMWPRKPAAVAIPRGQIVVTGAPSVPEAPPPAPPPQVPAAAPRPVAASSHPADHKLKRVQKGHGSKAVKPARKAR